MNFTSNPGRLVLTLILVFFGFGDVLIDGNATHLFNPGWPPHARYHLVMQFVAFAALGGLGLHFLWRPGREALLHLKLAALIPVALIGSLYVAALVPTTSTLYGADLAVPHVLGLALPPNLLAGTLALLCMPFAYRSARRALEREAEDEATSASEQDKGSGRAGLQQPDPQVVRLVVDLPHSVAGIVSEDLGCSRRGAGR